MSLYGGIDLHANNSVIVVINEQDEVLYQKRLPNDLPTILGQLTPYHTEMKGLVVESTYNWYWLVDGLMEADYRVHLANPAAIQQYNGLKYTDDHSDARWLAHLLRLGVLPEGYIYPKAERAVRDLLRKRARWKPVRSAAFPRWGTMLPIAVVWTVRKSATASAKGRAMSKMAIRIWRGPIWRRRSLPCAFSRPCSAFTNASWPRAATIRCWHGKPRPTNSHGPAITSCETSCPMKCRKPLAK